LRDAKRARKIGVVVDSHLERLSVMINMSAPPSPIPTGFTKLDRVIGGLAQSDLVAIAGIHGTGKTPLTLHLALNAAKCYGQRVAFFSLQMSADQVVGKMLACETGIAQDRLMCGEVTTDEMSFIVEASGVLSDTPIMIDDTPGMESWQLLTTCYRLYAENGLDLVVIDGLELMQADGERRSATQDAADIVKCLKNLARELDIPVVTTCVIPNVAGQRASKLPTVSDLGSWSSLGLFADVVLLLHREDMVREHAERENIVDILIAQSRRGPTTTIPVYASREGRFSDLVTVAVEDDAGPECAT
jgi:replicative DNA helicase